MQNYLGSKQDTQVQFTFNYHKDFTTNSPVKRNCQLDQYGKNDILTLFWKSNDMKILD